MANLENENIDEFDFDINFDIESEENVENEEIIKEEIQEEKKILYVADFPAYSEVLQLNDDEFLDFIDTIGFYVTSHMETPGDCEEAVDNLGQRTAMKSYLTGLLARIRLIKRRWALAYSPKDPEYALLIDQEKALRERIDALDDECKNLSKAISTYTTELSLGICNA